MGTQSGPKDNDGGFRLTTGASESNGESSLVSALQRARSDRDHAGGYLVEWVDGRTWAPDWMSARAEAAQVARRWQATIRRVDRNGNPDEVVQVVPGAGSADVVVLHVGDRVLKAAA